MNDFLIFGVYFVIFVFFVSVSFAGNEKAKECWMITAREEQRRRYILEREKIQQELDSLRLKIEMQRRAYSAAAAATRQPIKPWWCDVLGVPANATAEQISRAYKLLAKKNHPDHGGGEEAMKRLNVARSAALSARAKA
ncbi:J domain-containing protein [Shinella sp. JR1-6]|uniref:J domain-containing protein n=1 Tax=Shinella sp. JR1-6 TaxID=2527671 RepID=UPI00102D5FE5|nr:J domain-containing protein [Shinella sp. JR1-6]TAA49796.1 J domain-containing protein [Shinella sp. JR1-6]